MDNQFASTKSHCPDVVEGREGRSRCPKPEDRPAGHGRSRQRCRGRVFADSSSRVGTARDKLSTAAHTHSDCCYREIPSRGKFALSHTPVDRLTLRALGLARSG